MEKRYEDVIQLLNNGEDLSGEQQLLLFDMPKEHFKKYVECQTLSRVALNKILSMPDNKANEWMKLYIDSAGTECLDFPDKFALPMIKRADDATLIAICGRAILSEKQQMALFDKPNAKKFIVCLHKEGTGLEGEAFKKAKSLGWI